MAGAMLLLFSIRCPFFLPFFLNFPWTVAAMNGYVRAHVPGETALVAAARRGHLAVVGFLLDHRYVLTFTSNNPRK